MCGAGPGGLKFLVIGAGILWYLGYFLPMFSSLTGVDRKKKNLCLVVSLQHFKEDVCRYLGSLGVG